MKNILFQAVVAVSCLLNVGSVRAVPLPLPSFAKFAELSVNGYSGAALTGVPVLVRIGPSTISGFSYDQCQADGSDIRFADQENNQLPHEIDTWNPEGESLVWVRLPTLTPTTAFKMFWSADPAGLPESPVADAWAGYIGVWHMGEAAGNAVDATGHGLDGVPTGTQASGMVGDPNGVIGVARVNQTSPGTKMAGLVVPNYESHATTLSKVTVSGWFVCTGTASNCPRPVSHKTSYTQNNGWEIQYNSSTKTDGQVRGSSSTNFGFKTADITDGWLYLMFVFDGDTGTVYQNGTQIATGAITAVKAHTVGLGIGNNANVTEAGWCGSYDEVRLYDGAAGPDRAQAEYATVANREFLSYGDAQSLSSDDPYGYVTHVKSDDTGLVTVTWNIQTLGAGASSAEVYAIWGSATEAATEIKLAEEAAAGVGAASFVVPPVNLVRMVRIKIVNDLGVASPNSQGQAFNTLPESSAFVDFPDGYEGLEFVQTSGGQWINTLYTPACTDKIELKVRPLDTYVKECYFCARTKETVDTFALIRGNYKVDNVTAWRFRFDRKTAASTYATMEAVKNGDYSVVADGLTLACTVNGEPAATMTSGDFTPGSPLVLFASHEKGTAALTDDAMTEWARCRFHYLRVTDAAGAVKVNLFPCRRVADGTLGLYDVKRNQFFAPSGAIPFAEADADLNVSVPENGLVTVDENVRLGSLSIGKNATAVFTGGHSYVQQMSGWSLSEGATLGVSDGATLYPYGAGIGFNAKNLSLVVNTGARFDASKMTVEYNGATSASGAENLLWSFDDASAYFYTVNWGGKSNGAMNPVKNSTFAVRNGSDVYIGTKSGANSGGNSRGLYFGALDVKEKSNVGLYSISNRFEVLDSTLTFSTGQGQLRFAGTDDSLFVSNSTFNANNNKIEVYGFGTKIDFLDSAVTGNGTDGISLQGGSSNTIVRASGCSSFPGVLDRGTDGRITFVDMTDAKPVSLQGTNGVFTATGSTLSGDIVLAGTNTSVSIDGTAVKKVKIEGQDAKFTATGGTLGGDFTVSGVNPTVTLNGTSANKLFLQGVNGVFTATGATLSGAISVGGESNAVAMANCTVSGAVTVTSTNATLAAEGGSLGKVTLVSGTSLTVDGGKVGEVVLPDRTALYLKNGATTDRGTAGINLHGRSDVTIEIDDSTFTLNACYGHGIGGGELEPLAATNVIFRFLGAQPKFEITSCSGQYYAFFAGTQDGRENENTPHFSFVVPQAGYAEAPIYITGGNRGARVFGNTPIEVKMEGDVLPEKTILVPIIYDSYLFSQSGGRYAQGWAVNPTALTEYNKNRIPEGSKFVLSEDKSTLYLQVRHRKYGLMLIVR